jgi:DNA-binding transcriptional MerR regulator
MAVYKIETIAQLCGVHPLTLRAWQHYGLIEPQRDNKGQRWYTDEDLSRIYQIIDWITQGVPAEQVAGCLQGTPPKLTNSWPELQAEMLTALDANGNQIARRLLWRYGRDYPPAQLVNNILRPLRRFLGSRKQAQLQQQKALLDYAIIEYTTTILKSGRKNHRPQVLMLAMQINDPIEIWLESLKLAGEGLQVELLPGVISEPELSSLNMEHILIWSDVPLSERQQVLYQHWLEEGLPVTLLGHSPHQLQVAKTSVANCHPLDMLKMKAFIEQGGNQHC